MFTGDHFPTKTLYMHKILSVVFMINFFFKKEKRYVETVQYLESELQPLALAACVVSKELNLFLACRGGGGRAGSSWGTVGVRGSSWLQPRSAWIKHHAQELAPVCVEGGGLQTGGT